MRDTSMQKLLSIGNNGSGLPKLKALFLSLVFPAFYFIIRLFTQQIWLFAVRAGEQARAPSLSKELLDGRVAEAMLRYTSWILITGAAAAVALLFLGFARRRGGLAAFAGFAPMRSKGDALRAAALGIALNLGLNSLMTLLPFPESWLSEHSSSVSDPLSAGGFIALLICTVIAAPLAEEIVFRGISHNILLKGFSPVVALMWQALLFAGFHGTKLQLVYAFLAALAIGAVYRWQGTLRAPLIVHMAFNASSVFIPGFRGGAAARVAVVAVSAAIVAVTLLMLKRSFFSPEKPAL